MERKLQGRNKEVYTLTSIPTNDEEVIAGLEGKWKREKVREVRK